MNLIPSVTIKVRKKADTADDDNDDNDEDDNDDNDDIKVDSRFRTFITRPDASVF